MKEIEICCSDTSAIVEAAAGGARRVELCTGLTDGGLTPPSGMIRLALERDIPSVNVLIRTRPGDFICSPFDLECMIREIKEAVSMGATGIVCGALNPDGTIDLEATARMREAAGNAEFVFHRAIDLTADPVGEVERLAALGCDRILTSGGAPSAIAGTDVMASMVRVSDGRIRIMAGAGVNPENAAEILRLTDADAVHSTARSVIRSAMTYHRPGVSMGAPGSDEYSRAATDRQVVRKLIDAVRRHEKQLQQ